MWSSLYFFSNINVETDCQSSFCGITTPFEDAHGLLAILVIQEADYAASIENFITGEGGGPVFTIRQCRISFPIAIQRRKDPVTLFFIAAMTGRIARKAETLNP